jgi:hypothetical protein
MALTKYKIWAAGGLVGDGVSQSIHVGVSGIAKAATVDFPNVIANELICAELARSVLLPVPTGFIIDHDSRPHYVSLNFNLAGEDLPPIDARAVISADSRLACGVILFDIWVANSDRHRKNIAFDATTNRIQIFDHGHALFGAKPDPARFGPIDAALGIGSHCLAAELTSLTGMLAWNDRILAIPEYYIREVVGWASEIGIPAESVQQCTDFLLRRREGLLNLLRGDRPAFPHVQPQLWDELAH